MVTSKLKRRFSKGLRPRRPALRGASIKSSTVQAEREPSTLELVDRVVQDPGTWLRSPNSRFENRSPIDLIGTAEEVRVRNILFAVEYGLY